MRFRMRDNGPQSDLDLGALVRCPNRSGLELESQFGGSLEQLRHAFLRLDGSRVYNLVAHYGQRYGWLARKRAWHSYHLWRSGRSAGWGTTELGLFDLLPYYLTGEEKLRLARDLHEQMLADLDRVTIRVSLSQPGDLAAVILQVTRLMRRVHDLTLPPEFLRLQDWLVQGDMVALSRLVRDTEDFIACRRLADLMVQTAVLSRLRTLVSPQMGVRVLTRFEIPTATVHIRFSEKFWESAIMADTTGGDQDFLVRLQEMALQQEHLDGSMTFVEYVMRTLTPEEQEKLRALAAEEGLRIEILLQELRVKTLAARGDIEATIATAERLKSQNLASKITSEHTTASGTTRIEITHKTRPCYIATACYGDPDHPDVRVLRRFRDERLLPARWGRAAVTLYECLSPPLARRLRPEGWFSGFVRRALLKPLVRRLNSSHR